MVQSGIEVTVYVIGLRRPEIGVGRQAAAGWGRKALDVVVVDMLR